MKTDCLALKAQGRGCCEQSQAWLTFLQPLNWAECPLLPHTLAFVKVLLKLST